MFKLESDNTDIYRRIRQGEFHVDDDETEEGKITKAKFRIENIKTYDKSKDILVDETCIVCLEHMDLKSNNLKITHCNHVFHNECLTNWFTKKMNCPFCRDELMY